MAIAFPNSVDSLPDPVGGDSLALSNGKPHSVHHKDLNDAVEALERQGVGPAFQNPKAATAKAAVTLANCTSLTADGPLGTPAVWTGYGEFANPAPVRTIATSSGETYVNAVFTGPSGGWLVCNLGQDYYLAGSASLGMRLYATRTPVVLARTIVDSLEIVVSDAPITGVTSATSTLVTAGATVTNPPNHYLPDTTWGTISSGLGSLTKIRAIAIRVRDIFSYTTVALRVNTLTLRASTELEAALSSGATLVPETYAPSGTQDDKWPLGQSGHAAIDLRDDYRIIYKYGGEHHVRELQNVGLEDGSAVADATLRAAIQGLMPGDKLKFPPNATYRVQGGMVISGMHDIEVDFNGATFYKDIVGGGIDSPLFSIISSSRLKMYNFSFFGYHDYDNTGADWTAITGTSVVGTTRTLTAQGHQARTWPGSGVKDGQKYIARDKDGNFVIELQLSDTNQVSKDCRIGIKTELGTNVASTVLTLTPTLTVYTIKLRARKFLHEKMQWFINKETATANTITLGTAKIYGAVSTEGGGPPFEGQRVINISGEADDIEIRDWYAEGVTSYVIHIQAGDGWGRNIRIHDWKARCVAVQGAGIVSCAGPVEVDNFALTEVCGNGFDVEPAGATEAAYDVRITNGYIRNTMLSAVVATNWAYIKNLIIDKIKVVNCQSFAGYGLGSIGGSVTNIFASAGKPATSVAPVFGWSGNDLEIRGTNMKWSNIHLSRGLTIQAAGVASYLGHDESDYVDGGVLRHFEAGGHDISDIFVDGGVTSVDTTNGVYAGGTLADPVLTEGAGGSNNLRNISHNSQSPLIFDPATTAQFAELLGTPEFHSLESRPWQRAAPHVFRAASVGTPDFYPGGTQAFSQPLYDVQSLSGAIATPITLIPDGTIVAKATVSGTPVVLNGSAIAIAPDSVVEVNCELSSAGVTTFATLVGSTYYGVRWFLQGSVDGGVTWNSIHQLPTLRLPGYRRARVYTGTFTQIRMLVQNYSLANDATVRVIGSWVGSRGNNLRMLNVPVTAGATTLAATFPNKTTPPVQVWAAVATTGGSMAAGAYSYRVGLRGPHTGPGVPDASRSATVGASGAIKLTSTGVGVPDPITGWYANSYTIFRKSPGQANFTERCDIIPYDPLANYHPGGSTTAFWLDNGVYVAQPTTPPGYTYGYPWATIPGGGYSSAQLDTHNESGWEPDTNYGVQVTPSWGTTAAATAKRVDGPDLAFGTAAPGGGGTADLFFVR